MKKNRSETLVSLVIVKVLGDLLYYFAFIASLSNYAETSYPLLIPAVICATSTGLLQILLDKKHFIPILKKDSANIFIKSLSLVPSLLTLLLASTPIDFIFLIPPIIYVSFIIFREKYYLVHKDYIEYFMNMCKFAILIFLLCLLALDWKSFLLYESGFILCGIFLMRQLRLYTRNDLKGTMVNLSSLFSVVFISAGSLGILYITRQKIGLVWSIFKYLFSFLLYLISTLMSAILWIFHSFIGLFGDTDVNVPMTEFSKPDKVINHIEKSFSSNEQTILQTILIIVTVIVVGIIIFKMLRNLQKDNDVLHESTDYEIIKPIPSTSKFKTPKLFKNNREKVRLSYIKYLNSLEKHHGKFAKSNTSWDIYQKTPEDFDNEKTLQLRNIYLHARYDLEKEVSQSDVQTAKKLVKEIHK